MEDTLRTVKGLFANHGSQVDLAKFKESKPLYSVEADDSFKLDRTVLVLRR